MSSHRLARTAAGTLLLATTATASTSWADTPPEQHPRPDPSVACHLLPDPGRSGDYLYPAGDDTATTAQDTPVDVDAIANDCANSEATNRTWNLGTPTSIPTAQDPGHTSGTIALDGAAGLLFTPEPGFSGQVSITYTWSEDGAEYDSGFYGPYSGRESTQATIAITITPAPPSTTPTPTPTPTTSVPAGTLPPPSPTASATPSRTTRPEPSPAAAPATAPAEHPLAAPPATLPNTGASGERPAILGALLLLLGGLTAYLGRRRRSRA